MAKLLSTIIDGFLASKNFISGALGSGWKIWKMNGRYKFEVDDVVVRNTMTVFELLISKIRAVKGALGITQASGKIKSVREDADNYYIQVEDEMSFMAHDIIRCMEFSGSQKNYWVLVSGVENDEIVIPKSEFENSSLPETGDEIVQFGNTTNPRRQSAIYLHADENGEPAIDVLFGIDGKSFDGKTKIRVGGDIPGADGYKGFYCENGMIKSVNTTGEVMYMLRPNGSGFVAKEAIAWNTDGSGSIGKGAISWRYDPETQRYVVEMGSNVILTWNNLDEQTKEKLKGEGLIVEFSVDGEEWHSTFEDGDLYQRQKVGSGSWNGPFKIVGQDANLLHWVKEWNSPENRTEIGGEYIISPKMFSGTKNAETGKLTGVAFGRGVVTVVENGVEVQKTGVFGLKDGKVTFSVDENGNANFKGNVEAESGKIGKFIIGQTESNYSWLKSGNTMGLSGLQLFFKTNDRTIYIGSNPGESISSARTAGVFTLETTFSEAANKWKDVNALSDFGLFVAAPFRKWNSLSKENIFALYVSGHSRFNGQVSSIPMKWVYVSNGTIPVISRIVYVTGNTGSDNPCYLDSVNAQDGQIITIVNTSTNHRVNLKDTAKGSNHWVLEGCCCTLIYLSSYGKWYPERFDW